MAKYRKKPMIVEAEVYKYGMEDGFGWIDQGRCFGCDRDCDQCDNFRPYINTPEGDIFISEGDYIITKPNGEKYLCNPKVFKEIYERID